MKRIKSLSAAIIAVAMFVGSSAFADSRHPNETWRDRDRGNDRGGYSDRGGYHDNDRVTMEGHVRSFNRERDGFRVQLDRGNYSYFIPERHLRNRRDFRVGVSIRLGGVFRGGSIFVDAVDFPGGGGFYDPYHEGRGGYDYATVRGVVDRIDFRRDTLVLREQSTGRFVIVDMRDSDRRYRSVDLDDLRRGDFLVLSGEWIRGNVFAASRVESVRSRGGHGRY